MAKLVKDYSLDHYRLGSNKVVLPKEMLDRMRSLKDLYLRNLPQKYRYYKNFRKLFYHPKTTATTRAMMIDAAFHRSAERVTEKMNLHAALKRENGRGRYLIDVETDRYGIPRNFIIVFVKSSTLRPVKVKVTPTLRRVLARGHVDPVSARVARQAFSGKIDKQRGLKIQTAILEIMKLIMMIKLQLEAIIIIHDREMRDPRLKSEKKNARLSHLPMKEAQKLVQKGLSQYGDPRDNILEGDFIPPDDYPSPTGLKEFYVQNLVLHCDHYLREGAKFYEFFDILHCRDKWDAFVVTYRAVRDYAQRYGTARNNVYEAEETMGHHLQLVLLSIKAIDSLVHLANYMMTININRQKILKKLKKMPPSRKIPRAMSHESTATWKVDSSKLYLVKYSRNMTKLKERLGKWKERAKKFE